MGMQLNSISNAIIIASVLFNLHSMFLSPFS